MFLPLIIAIWFGVIAYKAGRRWFVWAPVGAAIALVLNMVVRYIGIDFFQSSSWYRAAPFLIIAATMAMLIVVVIRFLQTSHIMEQIKEDRTSADNTTHSATCSACDSTLPTAASICPKCGQSCGDAQHD
jgi:uncharacterized paraquat-inducible protein A